jgi:bisphosphoglycerate-independent phosphoglycerate mutase (AlkP superfamily)
VDEKSLSLVKAASKKLSKVATYDLQPEMSAFELTDALIPELEKESRFCMS